MIKLLSAFPLLAAAPNSSEAGGAMSQIGTSILASLLAVVVFSIVGLIVFAVCFWGILRIVPFSVRKEIEDDQNTALAIIIGAMLIGISIIIAAAVHG
jgi:uncharacterized membrane protein YjfL (UPF0719 family)